MLQLISHVHRRMFPRGCRCLGKGHGGVAGQLVEIFGCQSPYDRNHVRFQDIRTKCRSLNSMLWDTIGVSLMPGVFDQVCVDPPVIVELMEEFMLVKHANMGQDGPKRPNTYFGIDCVSHLYKSSFLICPPLLKFSTSRSFTVASCTNRACSQDELLTSARNYQNHRVETQFRPKILRQMPVAQWNAAVCRSILCRIWTTMCMS